jgi:hypothetical protein
LPRLLLSLAAALTLPGLGLHAASAPPTVPPRLPMARPNLPPALRRGPVPTNFARPNPAARPHPGLPGRTNPAVAPRTAGKTNAPAKATWSQTFKQWQAKPLFYPVVIGVAVCVLGLILAWVFRARPKPATEAVAPTPVSKLTAKSARKTGAIHSCNVLGLAAGRRRIWQFDARGGRYVLNREQPCAEGEALPTRLVAKDWRALFQRKLNIAWLPPEHVFLRVVQLPRSDFAEMLAMVELQLEKLSPMPVAQTVWSFHVLPSEDGNLQTVIVTLVSRSVVEEFLGNLEGQGYLADRLELPLLDQLQTAAVTEDGAWIYPEEHGGKGTALVAWWQGGVLRNLNFLSLPPPGPQRLPLLKEQLMQMAWAGEMEGWLSGAPLWRLVAEPAAAADWEPVLREALEQPVATVTPLPAPELAALTARRSALADPRANLMPPEFAERYQQQFVDRLWMKGLVAVGGLYLAIVAVYMVGLGYANWRTEQVEGQVAALSQDYTNAIQLKARYDVLKERQELKYAGLECWNLTASMLPEDVTLDSMTFSDGKRFSLNGTAPSGQLQKLLDFEAGMRKATVNKQLFFDPNKGEGVQWRDQGQAAAWSLNLELKRSEAR